MGLSDDEILDHLPSLTQADLEAAWEYYEQHREEIDQAIRENDEAPSHCPVLDNPLIRVNRPPRS